jgi:hypothetical protein
VQTLPSVAVPNTPGSFSAVIDLASLSALAEVTFAVPGATPLDQVQVYFTTNPSAVNAASSIQGPLLAGPQPGPWPPQIPCRYAIFQRVGGTTTGLSAQISGQETPGTSANSGGSSGRALAVSNLAASGPIGTAPATVDQYAFFNVAQTTGSVNVTLPAPSAAANSRLAMVTNTGTVAFELYGAMVVPGTGALVFWNGTAWVPLNAFSPIPAQGANLGDASVTLTRAGQFSQYTMPAGTMSAARTVTLPSSTQGAQLGDIALISRLDVSAFTLTIANGGGGGGNTFVMPVSKVNFHMARFDGTNWNFMSGGVQ